jgi:hypothetical protein
MPPMTPDLVERLRLSVTKGHEPTDEDAIEAAAEIERLRAVSSDMLAVLNACRIAIKNRDQRPNEMKLLDAIKIAIANAEDVLGVQG